MLTALQIQTDTLFLPVGAHKITETQNRNQRRIESLMESDVPEVAVVVA